jgi:uncharacterized integral membrane protein
MRLLIALPFLLLLVLFALSNTQSVHIGLWPTDFGFAAPLSIVVLGAMAAAFALGALELWITAIGARRRARRAESRIRALEAQIEAMKPRPVLPTPTGAVVTLPVLSSDRRG